MWDPRSERSGGIDSFRLDRLGSRPARATYPKPPASDLGGTAEQGDAVSIAAIGFNRFDFSCKP